jgi:ankyrin repeat protein
MICNTREGYTPLHLACIFSRIEKGGDLDNIYFEVVMTLINKGSDVDARNCNQCTPLHFACGNGRFHVAMALIEKGAAIDVRNKWGFTPRCTQVMIDLFNRLWRSTPLMTAMHSNNMDAFQTLLNDDTYDVNEDVSTNSDGWTILHATASLNLNVNRMEYVTLLLQSPRIDVLAVTNSKSYTALHIACDRNDTEFARAIGCVISVRHGKQ